MPSTGSSTASAIHVADNDFVYISGSENINNTPRAVYWKNGEKQMLEVQVNTETYAWGIAVSNNGDVYVIGSEKENMSNQLNAVYWKNGIKVGLHSNNIESSLTHTIQITANDDVYISGSEIDVGSFGSRAVYWKNDVKTVLPDNSFNVNSQSIYVTDFDDVYVSGMENSKAVYWKNGAKTVLSGAQNVSWTSIYAANSKVYVAATERALDATDNEINKAIYWEDGQKIDLSANDLSSSISQIIVVGDDVYGAGGLRQTPQLFSFDACYWKNGAKTVLTDGSGIARALGIAVVTTSD
ncbi:hypothetical protein [uncultured Aquimarina sp.]|uniref:hypothetical protein n=1 Tax=uncultured Aquimarina sp. TaxID=575652 RepID=UPI00262EC56D|nr:hypothetical protein [uncultured Aquimarina sp.]